MESDPAQNKPCVELEFQLNPVRLLATRVSGPVGNFQMSARTPHSAAAHVLPSELGKRQLGLRAFVLAFVSAKLYADHYGMSSTGAWIVLSGLENSPANTFAGVLKDPRALKWVKHFCGVTELENSSMRCALANCFEVRNFPLGKKALPVEIRFLTAELPPDNIAIKIFKGHKQIPLCNEHLRTLEKTIGDAKDWKNFKPLLLDSVVARRESHTLRPTEIEPTNYKWPKLKQKLAESYLETVSFDCGSVKFPGLVDDKKLDLLTTYIELHTFESRDHRDAIPMLQALAEYPRLVLLGRVGSGKSTCLRHLAYALAGNLRGAKANKKAARELRDKKFPKNLRECVPVWVELKNIMPRDAKGNPMQLDLDQVRDDHWLWNQIVAQLDKPRCTEEDRRMLAQARKEKRCWFFLDGLDEITGESQMNFLRAQIKLFTDQVSPILPAEQQKKNERQNRVTITCRQNTWYRGWEIDGWNRECICRIAPLTRKERSALAEKLFHAAGFLPLGIAPHGPEAIRRLNNLNEVWYDRTLNRRKRLDIMGGTPLTFTMLAWLAGRSATLPRTRAALYEQVIHALLWSLDKEKQLPNSLPRMLENKSLERDAFVALLCQLAFDKLKAAPLGGSATIFYHELLNPIAQLATNGKPVVPGGEPEAWAGKVIATVQLRSGLLCETRVKHTYEFTHRSFHEFFAALHLAHGNLLGDDGLKWAHTTPPRAADGSDITFSIEQREELWETLRLACGHLATPFALKDQLRLTSDLKLEPQNCDAPVLFPSDLRPGSNLRTPKAAFDLLNSLAQHETKCLTDVNWHDVWLAGELLEELEPKDHPQLKDRDWIALQKNICNQLAKLIEGGKLTPPERAKAGDCLGRLGDQRDGVGCIEIPSGTGKLPKFSWVELPAVPGGEFEFGEKDADGKVAKGRIPAPFKLTRYPVTVAQYQAFVDAEDGYRAGKNWKDPENWNQNFPEMQKWWSEHVKGKRPDDFGLWTHGTHNHPVVVRWYEAVAFCRWLTERLLHEGGLGLPRLQPGKCIRLPHEAEWEWAARWNKELKCADARSYPWDQAKESEKKKTPETIAEEELARCCNCFSADIQTTCAVGLFPAGAADCGALDLSGNVCEWCGNSYDERSKDRVVRGGSFFITNGPVDLSCSHRHCVPPDSINSDLGFRCVLVEAGSGPW